MPGLIRFAQCWGWWGLVDFRVSGGGLIRERQVLEQ